MRMFFPSAGSWAAARAASTTAGRSTGRGSMRSFPAMIRETSSRSSMSWARVFVLRSIMPRARAVAASSSCSLRSSCVQIRIAPSGVRSSWEIIAMNSSFARFEASASVRAAASRRMASRRARSASSRAPTRARSSRSGKRAGSTSSAPASNASARWAAASMPQSRAGTRRAAGSDRSWRRVASASGAALAVRMSLGGCSRMWPTTLAPSGRSSTSKRGPSRARSRARLSGRPPTSSRREAGSPGASFMALTVQHSGDGEPFIRQSIMAAADGAGDAAGGALRPRRLDALQGRADGRPRGGGAGSSS